MGRSASILKEHLEKKWEADLSTEAAIRMSVETLLEVVEDQMNIEVCIAYDNKKFEFLDEEKKAAITEAIKKEKEEAEEAKKNKMKD